MSTRRALLLVNLSYKATHHVARINHPVHSVSHYHTWHVQLRLRGFTDAHAVQEWMHNTAPHFGDHGDQGAEDVADWWMKHAEARWNNTEGGLRVMGVQVIRDDGVGALLELE